MSHLEDHETDDGDQNKNVKVQIERKKFDLSDPEVIDDDCISKTQSYRPDLFVFVDIHQNENPRENLFTDLGRGEKDLIKGVRKFIDEESGVEASLEGDTDTPTDSIKITNGAISTLTSETIRDVDESILSRWKLENIDLIFKNEIVDFFKVQGMKLTMRKFSLSRYWVNKWVNGMNNNEVRRSNRQVSIVEADIKGNGDKSGCDETIGDKSPNFSVIDRKSLIYEVENGPEIKNIIKEKKAVYSPEFKSQVLDFYTKYGPGVASSKFGINKTLLLQWRRDSGGSYYKYKDPLVKSKTIYSIEFKLKVLDFYKEKGPTAATNKFGINKRQLFDWRKNYSGAYYKNECMDNKKKGYYSPDFKSNVLDFYIEHGPAAATRKFGIAKRQLYDWRKKSGGSYYTNVSAKKKKKSIYTPDFKREVLDFYAENGPKATEEKFGVNQRILFEWRKKNDCIYYNNTVKMRITDCDSHVTENLIGENNHNVKAGHQSCKVSKNVAKINVEYGNDDEVLNPIQRSRKVYDEALKNKVIKYFQKYGRAKTTQEFNIRNSLIYKWIKSGVTPKFSCQFKKDAIKSCKVHGVLTTSKNLQVSYYLLRKWLQDIKEYDQIPGSRPAFTEAFRREVVGFKIKNGRKEAINKFGVSASQINRWCLRYNIGSNSQHIKKEEILEFCEANSVKAAAKQFNVKIPTIWRWKQKHKICLKCRDVDECSNRQENHEDDTECQLVKINPEKYNILQLGNVLNKEVKELKAGHIHHKDKIIKLEKGQTFEDNKDSQLRQGYHEEDTELQLNPGYQLENKVLQPGQIHYEEGTELHNDGFVHSLQPLGITRKITEIEPSHSADKEDKNSNINNRYVEVKPGELSSFESLNVSNSSVLFKDKKVDIDPLVDSSLELPAFSNVIARLNCTVCNEEDFLSSPIKIQENSEQVLKADIGIYKKSVDILLINPVSDHPNSHYKEAKQSSLNKEPVDDHPDELPSWANEYLTNPLSYGVSVLEPSVPISINFEDHPVESSLSLMSVFLNLSPVPVYPSLSLPPVYLSTEDPLVDNSLSPIPVFPDLSPNVGV